MRKGPELWMSSTWVRRERQQAQAMQLQSSHRVDRSSILTSTFRVRLLHREVIDFGWLLQALRHAASW